MKLKMLRASASFLTLISVFRLCSTPLAFADTTSTTLGITNIKPTISVVTDNGSSGTTPTNQGTDISFTVSASDPNGDSMYIAICKENSITANADAAPTCNGTGAWYVDPTERATPISGVSVTTSTTGLALETYAWYAFACDKVQGYDDPPTNSIPAARCSDMLNTDSPFKVNHRPSIGTVTAGASYGSNTSVDPGSGGGAYIAIQNIGATYDQFRGVAIQPDGKIVAAGYTHNGTDYDFVLMRYNTDFTLDTSFDTDGIVNMAIGSGSDRIRAVALQPDGKIVVGGPVVMGTSDFGLARYNTDGSLDTSFDTDGKVTTDFGGLADYLYSVAIQSDGKIVAGGASWNGSNNDFAVARYNTDGTLDTSFDTDGKVITAIGSSNDIAYSVLIQSDGKIVATGTSYNGSGDDIALVRYNTDGSLDTGFDTDGKVTTAIGSVYDQAFSAVIQSDGKIVTTGNYNGGIGIGYDFALVRYNTDGSLDTSFDTDGIVTTDIAGGADNSYSIAVQADGKIVAAGYGSVTGNYAFAMVRYNTNGSLDTTFASSGKAIMPYATGMDVFNSIALQVNGKIVGVGVTTTGADESFFMTRYTTSGAIDSASGNGSVYVRAVVTDTDTDTAADTVGMFVCSDATTAFDPAAGTCTGGTLLCSASGISSGANADCVYTGGAPIPTAHGSYPFKLYLRDSHNFADAGTANAQSYSVADTAPYVSDSNAYSVTDITLTAAASTAKTYTVTVKDDNGDNDITAVTGILYDDAALNLATGTCPADENDCWPGVSCSLSNVGSGTDVSATATCGFTVWHNANYSSNWRLHINPADQAGTVTGRGDSAAIMTNAVQAINVPESTIAYGTVALGGVSSGVPITIENMGNQILDVLIQGTDMSRTGGGGTIPRAQQKWHNTTQDFDYATLGNTLVADSSSATTKSAGCADRDIAVRNAHASGSGSDESLYLKLLIPSNQTAGAYTGTDTLASAASSTCADGQ